MHQTQRLVVDLEFMLNLVAVFDGRVDRIDLREVAPELLPKLGFQRGGHSTGNEIGFDEVGKWTGL